MNTKTTAHEIQKSPTPRLSLKLFIVGGRPESALAIVRLRKILHDHNLQSSKVQIVDIQKEPQLAKESQVVGTPMLVKEFPLPRKVVVGDLSDVDVILGALGLPAAKNQQVYNFLDSSQEPPVHIDSLSTDLQTIRVMLINFSPVVGSGIRTMLEKDNEIEVAPGAMDIEQTLAQLKMAYEQGLSINVALIKIRPGDFDGIAATQLIKKQFPEVSVILISEHDDHSNVIPGIMAGAGVHLFLKDVSTGNLSDSIHWVRTVSASMNTSLLRRALALMKSGQNTVESRTIDAAHLTEREVDVLRLMGSGVSNIAISKTLGISVDTAKKHSAHIIKKLRARSRTHAAIMAAQAGLTALPSKHI